MGTQETRRIAFAIVTIVLLLRIAVRDIRGLLRLGKPVFPLRPANDLQIRLGCAAAGIFCTVLNLSVAVNRRGLLTASIRENTLAWLFSVSDLIWAFLFLLLGLLLCFLKPCVREQGIYLTLHGAVPWADVTAYRMEENGLVLSFRKSNFFSSNECRILASGDALQKLTTLLMTHGVQEAAIETAVMEKAPKK